MKNFTPSESLVEDSVCSRKAQSLFQETLSEVVFYSLKIELY